MGGVDSMYDIMDDMAEIKDEQQELNEEFQRNYDVDVGDEELDAELDDLDYQMRMEMDNDGLKAPGDQVGGEQVKNSDEVELEEEEQIKTHVLKTMYNDYTGYGLEYDDLILVPFGDWKSYLKDVANEFAQCLPDGFEDFVDVESLFNYMLKDTYYLVQAINMINKTSEEDYERYEKVDSGEVDSISYVIIREVM